MTHLQNKLSIRLLQILLTVLDRALPLFAALMRHRPTEPFGQLFKYRPSVSAVITVRTIALAVINAQSRAFISITTCIDEVFYIAASCTSY